MIDLSGIQLDKTRAVPLYEQLRQGILNQIRAQHIPAGTRLPTEAELCDAFGISRPVVRQAYNMLIESGVVERMRGRGTFVRADDYHGLFINKQISFSVEMASLGQSNYRTRVCRAEWLEYSSSPVFTQLGLTRDSRCFHMIRMRYVEEKPYVLLENYIPEPLFPRIDRFDYEKNSLYRIFEHFYGVHVLRSHRCITARTATPEAMELFGLHRGAPVLCIENLAYDERDRAVEFSREYMSGYTQRMEYEVINK